MDRHIDLDALINDIVERALQHGYKLNGLGVSINVPKVEYNRLRQLVQQPQVLEIPEGATQFQGQRGEMPWSLDITLRTGPKAEYPPPLEEDSRLKILAEEYYDLLEDYSRDFEFCSMTLVISGREYDQTFDYTGSPFEPPVIAAQVRRTGHSLILYVQIMRGFATNDRETGLENIHAKEWERIQVEKDLRQGSLAEDDFLLVYGDELKKYLGQQLPAELDQLIRQVNDAVKSDPAHQLLPGKRKQIYDLIASYPGGDSVLKWLAAFTAIRTVHYWHEETPEMFRPFMLLTLARNALEGKADVVQMVQTAHAARSYYEEREDTDMDTRVIHAGMAAAEALLRVTGLERWAEISISDKITDDALDWSTSDVAKWAVSAYAGGTKRLHAKEINLEKRLEFWIWWLEEAIPAAWSTVAA